MSNVFDRLRQRAQAHVALRDETAHELYQLNQLAVEKAFERDAPMVFAAITAAGGNDCFNLGSASRATLQALEPFYQCTTWSKDDGYKCCLREDVP